MEGIIERLVRQKPWRQGGDVIFTAIEKLTNSREIAQFYQEYVGFLWRRGVNGNEKLMRNPEEVAEEEIRHILSYYPKKYRRVWQKTLKKGLQIRI